MNSVREVYLDYAAATYLDPRVKAAMEPYWETEHGNPSSLHRLGRSGKAALDKARRTVARILNCKSDEIIFTSGGTESLNLAIFGVSRFEGMGRGHLIASKIEHPAVLYSMAQLEKDGFEVTYLDVDEYGLVNPKDVKKALRSDTLLVAVMYANNEIGTVEPIEEIGKVIKECRREPRGKTPFFLVDACQAAGALDLDIQKLGADLLAINSSKIYGPKGVGCLYINRGVELKPLIYGGGQEGNLRSGTENVPLIVGLAKALEIAEGEREKEDARLMELRDGLIKGILHEIPGAVLNGHPTKRLPSNVNISVPGVDGEAAVIYLDEKGISCSTGSACSSVKLEPSHVILALGRPQEYARNSIRFSLGRKTTKEDIEYVIKILPGVAERLRQNFPARLEVGKPAAALLQNHDV